MKKIFAILAMAISGTVLAADYASIDVDHVKSNSGYASSQAQYVRLGKEVAGLQALAKAHGCDHTILYREEDFVKRVREITHGAGVPVVYDSIGKDTFFQSLDCLSPRGTMVTFGNASGAPPLLDVGILAGKGSLRLTRPTSMTYVHDRKLLEPMAADLFDMVLSGKLKIEINQRYPLEQVAQAHRDLESRKTTGSTILIP